LRKTVSESSIKLPSFCQYHSAQQRTAEQQHRQWCIYTALCCVLPEDH